MLTSRADALPGIGHACGHNLIASASIAGAIATSKVMKQREIGGKVVVFGTPAEEGMTSFVPLKIKPPLSYMSLNQAVAERFGCSKLGRTKTTRLTSISSHILGLAKMLH